MKLRVVALMSSFLLSVWAAARGGYVGPDYVEHFNRLIDSSRLLDFSASNPPLYYILGHALYRVIGQKNAFPITLSIIQAAANSFALWCFFQYSRRSFRSNIVHSAFCVFLTFLPVRLIHAVALGADSMTIPLFVLVLFCFDEFLADLTLKNACWIGLALAVAIFTKYSFVAPLLALLVIFVSLAVRRGWTLSRLAKISAVSLLLPSSLMLYSFWASAHVHGYNTEKRWLTKAVPADMDFADLFGLKRTDLELFRAPQYFKDPIRLPHRYSYLALSHMATFTDPMNLFQDLSVSQRFGAILIADLKTRRPWKVPVMQASMSMGVIWTVLALIGTVWTLWLAFRHLAREQLQREDVAALFGTSIFLLIFLPIPFVHGGTLFGYWTPRLILPALLYFFWAAFLWIDRQIVMRWTQIAPVVLALVFVQCAIEVVMLV